MPHRLQLGEVLDLLVDAVCLVDGEGRFVHVSAGFERILGYRPEEVVGRRMIELVAPEDRERTLQAASRVASGSVLAHFENHYLHKLGHRVPLMWTARWSDLHGLRIGVARDISERRRAERIQQALFAVAEAAHETREPTTLLMRVHAMLDRLLPVEHCALALRDPETGDLRYLYRNDEDDPPGVLHAVDPLSAKVIERGQAQREVLSDPGLGDGASCHWMGVPLPGDGGLRGCLSVSCAAEHGRYDESDLDLLRYVARQVGAALERGMLQARLERMAHRDPLTGLPNRRLLLDRLEVAIGRAHRHAHRLALLFVDLDDFKQVNDSRGHAAGDALLREVAERLQAAVRACDTVSRIGGDEFVVLVEDLAEDTHAEEIARTLRQRLAEPLPGLHAAGCRASIGIALFPRDGQDLDSLLSRADQAMYAEKHRLRQPASTD